MSHLLDELNPQQREAVEHLEGPLLVLAGAGSGKTRVITYRIAHLIENGGVTPESILAVTFTNKAADQMKDRVAALLARRGGAAGRPAGRPHLSTFHSFCASLLRRHIDRLGFTWNFSIYDEEDQQRVVKAAIEELGLAEMGLSPRDALARISYSKNCSLSPQDLYRDAADPRAERLALIYDRYQQKLRQAQALDFDDLLLKAVELFFSAPEVSEEYNRRFQFLLVDEFQDTNRIQYELLRQLTRAHQNLCAVGDEDQSIYRWRGADIGNILSFERDYAGTRLIRLEQNYRSTQSILDAATAVVSRNEARKGKTLWSDRGGGEKLGLFQAQDAVEEGWFVAVQVTQALAADDRRTLAVLYRTNAQSRVFEEALRQEGIEYRLVGGFSFYARAEVRDVLAYARLSGNLRDSAAFLRVVNQPPRGIGEKTVEALEDVARRRRLSLWEALEELLVQGASGLPARTIKALEGFRRLVQDLVAARERPPMKEFFRAVLERTGYVEMLRESNAPEAQDRLENLQELVTAAGEAESVGTTLAEFLQHAALVSEADQYDERARVTLMTLHSAKGLEFDTVFLVGLEEGLLPHRLSMSDPAALEEERRLCYVGMTRAKDRLVLSRARRRRGFGREAGEESVPSRFLREIPGEQLEAVEPTGARTKPRTVWQNALNSAASVERALGRRAGTSRWQRGAQVRHPKYGLGTVVDCEGQGEETKLTILFPAHGRKKFVEGRAQLERVRPEMIGEN